AGGLGATFRTDAHAAAGATAEENVRSVGGRRSAVVVFKPVPDFDGLPVGRYLAPYPVLPLLTAYGCYHGDCAFCNVGYGRGGHFRPLRPAQVVEQMRALQRKYGVRHIFFADEAMTPHAMREMSALLEARVREGGAPFHWCGCMRFEKAITLELLQSMSRAGCRMLLFGLETASPRMIELMEKGTRRETMSRILRESAAAGIWNHTFFFFGFPTETLEDAQETVNFVYAHGDVIHSASPGEFVLERYSPVHRTPQKYGVRRIIERPEKDLAIYFDYELASGLDAEMAHTITERLLDVLPGKRYGQYYAQDTYRLLYAGYLHEQGVPLPGWLADETK
ncbi:MAG: radical SAM protein, partial [Anaerolineae bacterium]